MWDSKKSQGFILIELLVVVVILAIIATAIFSTLAAGLKIWKRVSATAYLNEMLFSWEELQKNLNNQIPFQGVGFKGTEKEVAFPVLLSFQEEEKEGLGEVGIVRYYFEGEKCRCLCREKKSYGEYLENVERPCTPVITGVEDISFEYFGSGEGVKALSSWQTQWPYPANPVALRLKIGFGKENEKEFTTLIPLGM